MGYAISLTALELSSQKNKNHLIIRPRKHNFGSSWIHHLIIVCNSLDKNYLRLNCMILQPLKKEEEAQEEFSLIISTNKYEEIWNSKHENIITKTRSSLSKKDYEWMCVTQRCLGAQERENDMRELLLWDNFLRDLNLRLYEYDYARIWEQPWDEEEEEDSIAIVLTTCPIYVQVNLPIKDKDRRWRRGLRRC